MMLLFALLICALLYVRMTKRFTPAKDTALGLALCAAVFITAMYDVWLFVGDVMSRHYLQAAVDVVCFLSNAFIFSVYWYKLDVQLYRSKKGEISEEPVWVLMIGPYMYTSSSLLKLVKLVATQWCDDRHLVG